MHGPVVAVEGMLSIRPRDIKIGPDRPLLVWRKRKWLCTNTSCERKSFTESTPSVPPRARVGVLTQQSGQFGKGTSGASFA